MRSGRMVVVTGGAGFIGSHLCRLLVRRGDRVVCIDSMLTGRRENVADLLGGPRFELFERDIIERPLRGLKADQIYHLACAASPRHYQRNPIHTMITCVVGTWNYLELALRCGARFLLTSTSEVYGDPDVHPQPEDYRGVVNPTGPRACYDEGKRAAEALVSDYVRAEGVDARIARIFNTYGPRMRPDDGRVISNFIVQALNGRPLTIYGHGLQTRSFCYVDDMILGLVALMESETAGHQPYNLGNPSEFTVLALAELVLEMCGAEGGLERHPLPPDDPRQRRPDISRAERVLGWHPRVPLREGLKMTIRSFAAETRGSKITRPRQPAGLGKALSGPLQ